MWDLGKASNNGYRMQDRDERYSIPVSNARFIRRIRAVELVEASQQYESYMAIGVQLIYVMSFFSM